MNETFKINTISDLQQYRRHLNAFMSSKFKIQSNSLTENQPAPLSPKNKKIACEKKTELQMPTPKFDNQREKNKRNALPQIKASQNNILPKGIQNIGNTCYSSCILQIMLYNSKFSSTICKYRVNKDLREFCEKQLQSKILGPKKIQENQFIINGSEFILALQRFFLDLISDFPRQANPQNLFERLVDWEGRAKFKIGNQQDVFEFMDSVFQLIEEGYKLNDFKDLDQTQKEIIKKDLNCFQGIFKTYLLRSTNNECLSSQEIPFNHIIVDVNNFDLINAIKKSFSDFIEDFQWKVPRVFFFNLKSPKRFTHKSIITLKKLLQF